jgi:hypothetical protein
MSHTFDENEGWVSSPYNKGYSLYMYAISIAEENLPALSKFSFFGVESKNRVSDSEQIQSCIDCWLEEGAKPDQITISCAAYIGEEGLYWKMTSEEWLAKERVMPHYAEIDEANAKYHAEWTQKQDNRAHEDPF